MALRGLKSIWRRAGKRAPDGEAAQRALAAREAKQALGRARQLGRTSGYDQTGAGYGAGYDV